MQTWSPKDWQLTLRVVIVICSIMTTTVFQNSFGQRGSTEEQPSASHQRSKTFSKRSVELKSYFQIDKKKFRQPTDNERLKIGSSFLDLELAARMADQVSWIATGHYLFASREHQHHAISIKSFRVGWAINHQTDAERIILTSQEQLTPTVQEDRWASTHSHDDHLDQLRLSDEFHEANGIAILPKTKRPRLSHPLKNLGFFFPTRAVISHPLDCYSGRAMDHRQSFLEVRRLVGIQSIKEDYLALFHFKPSSYYHFYLTIYLKQGLPVQTDFWRVLVNPATNPETRPKDLPKALFTTSQHVASTISQWIKLDTCHYPLSLQSWTTREKPRIELNANFEWFFNDEITESAFAAETCGQLTPFEMVSRE